MLAKQLTNIDLLSCVNAVRNWRALALLLITLIAAGLVVALGGQLAGVSPALLALFGLLGLLVLFYGANAVGIMLMDEVKGYTSRPMMAACSASLVTSHRLILALLLIGLIYLAGLLVLALLLAICKIPFVGPVLYTVIFPISIVIAGTAVFALPTVIFPLAAPAVWGGATTTECVSRIIAIARKRLLLVVLLMIGIGFITAFVAALISFILFSGTGVTAGMSVPILGSRDGIPGLSAIQGIVLGGGGLDGHARAALVGGSVLFSAAVTLPSLVYLSGACAVYLRATDGIDMAAEQTQINTRLAAAKAKAKDIQAQAKASAAQYADRNTLAPRQEPASVAAALPIATMAVQPPAACPACTSPVLPDDVFCGTCGHKMK